MLDRPCREPSGGKYGLLVSTAIYRQAPQRVLSVSSDVTSRYMGGQGAPGRCPKGPVQQTDGTPYSHQRLPKEMHLGPTCACTRTCSTTCTCAVGKGLGREMGHIHSCAAYGTPTRRCRGRGLRKYIAAWILNVLANTTHRIDGETETVGPKRRFSGWGKPLIL